ncbi:hypothetical protein HELRODRAFT_176799 [Helobdella robusta]|uniref:SH3 domain-containing protein n=1 Tax=Helobdella robusta TaxID=6412 RepID=T1FAX3_HELRO|nr:hypothetical protein HELRODRAFT_176799 [Helobdella robusta]ESN99629.1 hypothetical protein HELRODRAFT_176799 [Helobdella robusta]
MYPPAPSIPAPIPFQASSSTLSTSLSALETQMQHERKGNHAVVVDVINPSLSRPIQPQQPQNYLEDDGNTATVISVTSNHPAKPVNKNFNLQQIIQQRPMPKRPIINIAPKNPNNSNNNTNDNSKTNDNNKTNNNNNSDNINKSNDANNSKDSSTNNNPKTVVWPPPTTAKKEIYRTKKEVSKMAIKENNPVKHLHFDKNKPLLVMGKEELKKLISPSSSAAAASAATTTTTSSSSSSSSTSSDNKSFTTITTPSESPPTSAIKTPPAAAAAAALAAATTEATTVATTAATTAAASGKKQNVNNVEVPLAYKVAPQNSNIPRNDVTGNSNNSRAKKRLKHISNKNFNNDANNSNINNNINNSNINNNNTNINNNNNNLNGQSSFSSPSSTISSLSSANSSSKTSPINLDRLTEDDIEDDREFFDLKTLETKQTTLHLFSPSSSSSPPSSLSPKARHLSYSGECFKLIIRKEGGSRLKSVTFLGVSHSGLRLMNRVQLQQLSAQQNQQYQFNTLEIISYQDIIDVCCPQPKTLQIHYNSIKYVVLYFKENTVYVKAIASYQTSESLLLSFKRGDIIKLTNKDQAVQEGWLYGTLNGRVGMFPAEYVQIDSFETMTNQTMFAEATKKYRMLEFAIKHFRKPINMSVSVDTVTSYVVRYDKGFKNKEKQDFTWHSFIELSPIEYSLTKIGSDKLNKIAVDKFINIMQYMNDYPMPKVAAATEAPPLPPSATTSSLLSSPPISSSSICDLVTQILSSCLEYPELRDEIYCQLVKQTTVNKSSKPIMTLNFYGINNIAIANNGINFTSESCQLGWRLLSLYASFFNCSDALHPYLIRYLEETAFDDRSTHYLLAETCLLNVRQTMAYGGRKVLPARNEISSVTVGRSTRIMPFFITDTCSPSLSIQTCTVARDVIDQLCRNIGISSALESMEYVLYVTVVSDCSFHPLQDFSYLMDTITDFSLRNEPFQLALRRFTWLHGLTLDPHRSTYIQLMYDQVRPDYLDGFMLNIQSKNLMPHIKEEIARLCALQMKINDVKNFADKKEVEANIPKNVWKTSSSNINHWVDKVKVICGTLEGFTTLQCYCQFLDILSRWPLFGSMFFFINSVSNNKVPNKCILAINKSGLYFLAIKTNQILWQIPIHEVLSARLRVDPADKMFIDIKHGNLLVQSTLQIQTNNADAIGLLVDKYIQILQANKGSFKNPGSTRSIDKIATVDSATTDVSK